MNEYRQFLAEYRRLAGLQEAPETRRGRGRNVMPADRPDNVAAPRFDNNIEPAVIPEPSVSQQRAAEPTSDINNAFDPNTSSGGARFLPGRAAQTRIENPPDPRLQRQFARAIADFIPGVGAAASGYDAVRAASQGDYLGAAGNLGTAVTQTVLPGGAMTAIRAAAAPFRQAVQSGTTRVAGASTAGATRAERAAGTAGISTAIAAPIIAGSTQADGDTGEAEAKAAEAARQQNIKLAGSTQADGNAGEAEARVTAQANQALERSRQAQADISTGGYSGGRTTDSSILGGLEPGEFTQRMKPVGTGITPGTSGQGLRNPPSTTFSPQIMQGTLPSTPATPAAPATSAATPTLPQVYQIGKGDTLSQIAAKSGTSVAEIMRLNPQITNPDRIGVGQKINIAGVTPAATYAGGVGTVADTQAKIKSGAYTPDIISTQAAQRAAASSTGTPNAPGSGPAQMTGKMVSVPSVEPKSAISQGMNQALLSKAPNQGISPVTQTNNYTYEPPNALPGATERPRTATTVSPENSSILPQLNPGQFTNAMKLPADINPQSSSGQAVKLADAPATVPPAPPNPNAGVLNTTTSSKENFQESILNIKFLAGLTNER